MHTKAIEIAAFGCVVIGTRPETPNMLTCRIKCRTHLFVWHENFIMMIVCSV